MGARLLDQARRDRIDVSHVVRREGAETGLIVDVVDGSGRWHYLEDLPEPVLLTSRRHRGRPMLREAAWVSVQLQQPSDAVHAALGCAGDARIVLDGAPAEDDRDALLAAAHLVRADAREAEMLAGTGLDAETAVRLGRTLSGAARPWWPSPSSRRTCSPGRTATSSCRWTTSRRRHHRRWRRSPQH